MLSLILLDGRPPVSSMSSSLSAPGGPPPPGLQDPRTLDRVLPLDGGGPVFLDVMDEKLPIFRLTDDWAPGSQVVKMLAPEGFSLWWELLPELLLLLLLLLLLPLLRRRLPSMMNMTAITTRAATLPTTGAAIHACELPSCDAAAWSALVGVFELAGREAVMGMTVVMGMVRTCVMGTFSDVETEVMTETIVSVVATAPVTAGGGVKNDAPPLGLGSGASALVCRGWQVRVLG